MRLPNDRCEYWDCGWCYNETKDYGGCIGVEECHYLDTKRQMINEPTDSEMLDWLNNNLSVETAISISRSNGDLRAAIKEMMLDEL